LVNLTILQKNLSHQNFQKQKVREKEKKKTYLRGALDSAQKSRHEKSNSLALRCTGKLGRY